ncbi:trigger factor [Alkalibacter mobilis]|uniref:hypothetical protein n=1 Tax=Alkalibacter mobilis TaxID=2787712 RepID=UPI00189DF3E9|nr:hypothetical protein [Alkalibacter mobilis]MBF7096825.1 hypothetical protein [Alkalibacter mobilis]
MDSITEISYKGIKVDRFEKLTSPKKLERIMKDAVIDKVLEINDIDVPKTQVDEEVKMMLVEYNHRLRYESMGYAGNMELEQDDLEELLVKFRAEAFKLIKTKLILEEIIKAENLEVTQKELEEEARALSERQHISIDLVKDFLGENFESLKGDLLINKAIDLICDNAEFI